MSSSSASKRDREQAKRAKAEAKRQRRQAGAARPSIVEDLVAGPESRRPQPVASSEDLLRRIEEVHRLHDEGRMSDDDFQEIKADLLGQLPVD